MPSLLAVTAPFFALVLLGWAAARSGALPAAAVPGLNAFVLFFALPCLLLRFGRDTPLAELLDLALLAIYLAAMVMVVTLALALGRALRWPRADTAFGALVAAFPNSGFMGVPLLVALLGPAAAGPVICTLLADFFVTSTLCLALARAPGASEGRVRAVAAALKAAALNPLPWAIAVGAVLRATGLALPAPVDRTLALLADAASPVALFTIGAVLWTTADPGRGQAWRQQAQALPAAACKLLVHPLAVLALGRAAQAAGAPVAEGALQVLVLAAALPSASNVVLLAQRQGADVGRVARIVMASTVGAFATLAGWASLLQPN